jgi:hypothetical protein
MTQANELINEQVAIKKAGRKKIDPDQIIKLPEGWSLKENLKSFLEDANKKELGGKITAAHLIEWAIENMKKDQINELREKTLSDTDRIDREWNQFKAENGSNISRDQFTWMKMNKKPSKKDLN